MTCKIPVVRLEVRAAPRVAQQPRSGAVIVDIHDLSLSSGAQSDAVDRGPRFADAENFETSQTIEDVEMGNLVSARCRRLVFAYSLVGESRAKALLSLGPLSARPDPDAPLIGSPSAPTNIRPSPRPCVTVSQGAPVSSAEQREVTSLVLTVDIPSVFVKASKDIADGLQLWADDVSRLVETAFGSQPSSADSSRDPSLIGSRFFSKSRRSTSDSISTVNVQRSEATMETIIKVAVGEGENAKPTSSLVLALTFL